MRNKKGCEITKRKLILVLIDALSFQAAHSRMSYMQHLVENRIAALYQVQTELPTLSRPLYEVILTGTKACQNGVTHNFIIRRSHEVSIFELAKSQGLKTAAAAYSWISELYNRAPFEPYNDREQTDIRANIQYGKFYYDDFYPDSHLFTDGEILRRRYDPDLLLIHPMGVDLAGHQNGGESREYLSKTQDIDNLLADLIPAWLDLDYQIIVTADHGMNANGNHGGLESSERIVPLWTLGSCFEPTDSQGLIPQLGIAPAICKILNVDKSARMIDYVFPGFIRSF